MGKQRLRFSLSVLAALGLAAMGCAHSPDTVVHVSAPNDIAWEVQNAEGARVCALPCSVELDEHDAVSVVRNDGRLRFLLRQENLGEGAFSASIRVRSEPTSESLAARAFAGALSGAGAVLAESRDREQLAAGAFLTGMGNAVRIASEGSHRERTELWVQRTSEANR